MNYMTTGIDNELITFWQKSDLKWPLAANLYFITKGPPIS